MPVLSSRLSIKGQRHKSNNILPFFLGCMIHEEAGQVNDQSAFSDGCSRNKHGVNRKRLTDRKHARIKDIPMGSVARIRNIK